MPKPANDEHRPPEPAAQPEEGRAPSANRRKHGPALVLLHVGALGLGLWIGSASQGRGAPTPLAQLGFALTEPEWGDDPETHSRLSAVAGAARQSFPEERRGLLDLVLTVRGSGPGGQPWERAMEQCKALGWPRCDRPAMVELQRRSRP